MSVDVAVVGTPFLDLTFERLPRIPAVGEELLASALHVAPGGAGMVAVGLARLGTSVALMGPVGRDAGGRILRDLLAAEGVSLMPSADSETSATALLSTPQGVAMVTALGRGEVAADDIAAAAAEAVVVSLGRLALAPRGAAVHAGTGGLEVGRMGQPELALLARARSFICTADEAATLTGEDDPEEAARRLAANGTTAVVTLGADGAVAAESDRLERVSAVQVEAVDATGAGDLFQAAYVWAGLRGAALNDRLAWACLYAGLSVREPTALGGALHLDDLLREGRERGLTPP